MKIVHFLPWYSDSYIGGTEQFLINLAKAQKRLGYEVEIIGPNCEQKDKIINHNDLKVFLFSYPYEDKNLKFLYGKSKRYSFASFKLYLENLQPDLIHFHGTDPRFKYLHDIINRLKINTLITPHLVGFSCPHGSLLRNNSIQCDGKIEVYRCTECIVGRNNKIPLRGVKPLTTLISFLFVLTPYPLRYGFKIFGPSLKVYHHKEFIKYLGRQSNIQIDVLNAWYRDVLFRNGIKKERIIMYNLPFSDIRNYVVSQGRIEKKLKLLFVGRFSSSKGVAIIIESIKSLESLKDRLSWTFIGQEVEEELVSQLKEMIKEGYDIKIEGVVENSEIQNRMTLFDYLLFPSVENEMLPLTIQEAIKNGLPVIASDLAGCKSLIIEDVNGHLFTSGKAEFFTDLIKRLIDKGSKLVFEYKGSDKRVEHYIDHI